MRIVLWIVLVFASASAFGQSGVVREDFTASDLTLIKGRWSWNGSLLVVSESVSNILTITKSIFTDEGTTNRARVTLSRYVRANATDSYCGVIEIDMQQTNYRNGAPTLLTNRTTAITDKKLLWAGPSIIGSQTSTDADTRFVKNGTYTINYSNDVFIVTSIHEYTCVDNGRTWKWINRVPPHQAKVVTFTPAEASDIQRAGHRVSGFTITGYRIYPNPYAEFASQTTQQGEGD